MVETFRHLRYIFPVLVMSLFSFIILVFILLVARGEIAGKSATSPTLSRSVMKTLISKILTPPLKKLYYGLDKIRETLSSREKKADEIQKHEKRNFLEKNLDEKIQKSNEIQSERSFRETAQKSFHHHAAETESIHAVSTYHYYDLGLDPINIVFSVSLLSFLLHTLGTLLGHAGLTSPIVEARSDQDIEKDISDLFKKKFPYSNEV